MKEAYEVTGTYPARRPLPIGSTVELAEEAARYHVLAGKLRKASAPVAEAGPVASKRKRGGK
ncbi:hypothetical protein ASD64_07080 [Mesorhizobium sp. Root157]|uniref:hypothetical protein n=1 Tax=Mesorhizobium sp. Root157 TaxID=1736477 RepID=UPI000700BE2A|nr:hypothetical protein [Mesorhizobium sp. Root157]KQZ87198.1 hypothetical protein ASD64_07080 [Mesorhizobium sp. Root157]